MSARNEIQSDIEKMRNALVKAKVTTNIAYQAQGEEVTADYTLSLMSVPEEALHYAVDLWNNTNTSELLQDYLYSDDFVNFEVMLYEVWAYVNLLADTTLKNELDSTPLLGLAKKLTSELLEAWDGLNKAKGTKQAA